MPRIAQRFAKKAGEDEGNEETTEWMSRNEVAESLQCLTILEFG
jgi:hypothetical protein